MDFSLLANQFINGVKQTQPLEFIGVVFGVASVLYSRKENILVYPVGIISTLCYIYLYLTHGLYADASVNLYYTVMSIFGWVLWAKKKEGKQIVNISYSSLKEYAKAILFFGTCWIVLWFILKKYTDSSVPIADSFTAAAAFTGMWLMNNKKIENWVWWIITNTVSIPLNFSKGLVFSSFQYVVFLLLAILGWISWHKKYLKALHV